MSRARGEVVELGSGSGPTLPLHPAAVTSVRAVEPSAVARRPAARRVAAARVPVEHVGLDLADPSADLPLPDVSADTGVSTFTLCTIGDVERALREVGADRGRCRTSPSGRRGPERGGASSVAGTALSAEFGTEVPLAPAPSARRSRSVERAFR